MSRSGYNYDIDTWDLIRYRGAVNSAIKGKRGQAALVEMLAALDAMPVHELIAKELVTADGAVCALGALAAHRKLDVKDLDPEDPETVAGTFNVATALVCEITYMNDEYLSWETSAMRWTRMRAWVAAQLPK